MENENVYKKIQEFFGGLHDNFSLLEEPVDVSIQMEYFETSGKTRGTFNEQEAIDNKDRIFDPNTSIEDKKLMLAQMASIPNTEVYRTIEAYAKQPDEELKSWSLLALQENRLLLESHLLDRRQVFISTGLGGKGQKLRYFVVLINTNAQKLEPFQQKIVHTEMEYALNRYGSELEKLDFKSQYTTMRVVVPISSDLTKLFREGIDECNQFGGFLSNEFIITNMKELSEAEITEAIETSGNSQVSDDDFPPVD